MEKISYAKVELNSKEKQRVSKDHCFSCPIYNKVFYTLNADNWVYKMDNDYKLQRVFCSWSCLRKAEKILKPELYTVYD